MLLAYESVIAMAAVCGCSFELVDHPPYSTDLGPSDYFLFSNMKKHLARKKYQIDDEAISAVESFFEGQDENFDTTGIQAEQHKWEEHMDHRGDYVER